MMGLEALRFLEDAAAHAQCLGKMKRACELSKIARVHNRVAKEQWRCLADFLVSESLRAPVLLWDY
jgi:hypothetical protein